MKLDKLIKILGVDTAKDIEAMPSEMLKEHIVMAERAIKEAKEELEANPKYQEIKENLKALSEGLREVRKRQNAIIAYAILMLEGKGE